MAKNHSIKSESGFSHSILPSFSAFREFENYFANDMGFVFRGHAQSDWVLETSLDRLIRKIKPVETDLKSTYEFQLELFVKSIRGRTSVPKDVNTAMSTDALWSLGQHYGLATPLLDWTDSLYIALFFAFSDSQSSPNGCRTVWALHRDGVSAAMNRFNKELEYYEQFAFVDPITDDNSRLVSQAGVFTRQPLDFNVQEWVQKQFQGFQDIYMYKIDVPNSERMDILRHLRQMNIHSGSVFPDLVGASLKCNETLELLADKRRRLVAESPNNNDFDPFKPLPNGGI